MAPMYTFMWLLLAQPAGTAEVRPSNAEPPAVVWARVHQVDLPALGARQAAASAKARAATEYFAGQKPLEAAFPDLATAPLTSPAWIEGRLRALDAAGVQRSSELLGPPPAPGPADEVERWRRALVATLDTEEDAAQSERRLLLSLRALVDEYPEMRDDRLAPMRRRLTAAAEEAQRRYDASQGEERQAQAAAAAAAAAERSRWDGLITAIIRYRTIPTASPPDVTEDLETLHSRTDDLALARVQLAAAFVDEASRAEIGALAAPTPPAPVPTVAESSGDELENRVANAESQAAEVARTAAEVNETLARQLAETTALLDNLVAAANAVRDGPPVGRAGRATQSYRQLRELVADLRRDLLLLDRQRLNRGVDGAGLGVQSAREAIAAERARIATEPPGVREGREATLVRWEQALASRAAAAASLDEGINNQRAALLLALQRAKEARRSLRRYVPAEERLNDSTDLVNDVRVEFTLIGPNLWALVQSRVRALISLPRSGVRLNVVMGVVFDAFWILFGIVVWRLLRRRVDLVVKAVVDRMGRRRTSFIAREVAGLAKPMVPTVQRLLDLIAVWLLMRLLRESLPEVALGLLVYWQFLLYRFVVRAWDLVVARPTDRRPSLWTLTDEEHATGARTIKLLTLWVILRQFVRYLMIDVLGADALNTVATLTFWVLAAVLAFYCLHVWEPILQAAIRRGGGQSRFITALARTPHRSVLTRWLWAIADVFVLILRKISEISQGTTVQQSRVGRFFRLVSRLRMRPQAEVTALTPARLPEELAESLLGPPGEGYLEREATDEAFFASLNGWFQQRRRGAVALIGDDGAGKRTWLDHTTDRLTSEGNDVTRIQFDRRMYDGEDLLRFMSNALGLTPSDSLDHIVDQLLAWEPRIFILADTQWTFLRTVGGFEGIRCLLQLLGRCDDRHFWAVAMHRPAWWYLSRVEKGMGMDIFGAVIELPPMTDAELKVLVTNRITAAGFRPDYRRLVRNSALSGRFGDQLETSITAFYRLLADASEGIPAVALALMKDCLLCEDTEDKVVQVMAGEGLAATDSLELGETELFNLAAIRILSEVDVADLSRVNNMPAGTVQVSLEVLESHGLIDKKTDRVAIHPRHLAAITRVLRRRHFLHW